MEELTNEFFKDIKPLIEEYIEYSNKDIPDIWGQFRESIINDKENNKSNKEVESIEGKIVELLDGLIDIKENRLQQFEIQIKEKTQNFVNEYRSKCISAIDERKSKLNVIKSNRNELVEKRLRYKALKVEFQDDLGVYKAADESERKLIKKIKDTYKEGNILRKEIAGYKKELDEFESIMGNMDFSNTDYIYSIEKIIDKIEIDGQNRMEKGEVFINGSQMKNPTIDDILRASQGELASKAEEEAKRKVEEEARIKAEEEAKRKVEEEARRKAEEEARIKAEEEARRKAEEEARIKAEEEARRVQQKLRTTTQGRTGVIPNGINKPDKKTSINTIILGRKIGIEFNDENKTRLVLDFKRVKANLSMTTIEKIAMIEKVRGTQDIWGKEIESIFTDIDPNFLDALIVAKEHGVNEIEIMTIFGNYIHGFLGAKDSKEATKNILRYNRNGIDYIKPSNILSMFTRRKEYERLREFAYIAEDSDIANIIEDNKIFHKLSVLPIGKKRTITGPSFKNINMTGKSSLLNDAIEKIDPRKAFARRMQVKEEKRLKKEQFQKDLERGYEILHSISQEHENEK